MRVALEIYYEVFHCNKNTYVDVLHNPLVDAYDSECLGLSDEFSLELGTTHSLGVTPFDIPWVCD